MHFIIDNDLLKKSKAQKYSSFKGSELYIKILTT